LAVGPVPMNQLQFNLNPLQGQPGLPARFRPPQPIIIEKYGNAPNSGQLLVSFISCIFCMLLVCINMYVTKLCSKLKLLKSSNLCSI